LLEQELNSDVRAGDDSARRLTPSIAKTVMHRPRIWRGHCVLHVNGTPIQCFADPADWDRIAVLFQTQTGIPTYWAINQNQFLFQGPTPDGVYQLELYSLQDDYQFVSTEITANNHWL